MPERTVGRWKLTQELGQGSFGEVWQAESTQGELGAIKLFHRQGGQFAERAMLEAKALAKIAHPNLAEILDLGRLEGAAGEKADWYLVTRFIEGRSLAAELASRGVLPPGRAVAIALGVARALQAMHGRGLLHRDIKPSNVLLPAGKADDAAVLVDLGLAGFVEQRTGQTLSGQFFGTPAYMAPEQASAAPQDGRTDVWGLGVLVYQMLYGKLPFARETLVETMVAVMNDPPPLPGGDAALNAILARALNKKPADRFASMAELVAALDAWMRTPAAQPAPEISQAPVAPAAIVPRPIVSSPLVVPRQTGAVDTVRETPASRRSTLAILLVGLVVVTAAAAVLISLRGLRWGITLVAAAGVGAGTLWLLRRRRRALPAVANSLARAKQKSDGRQLVTESLAISMDDLLDRSKQLQIITASIALEFQHYVGSKESGDRSRALENALRLIEHLEGRAAKASERRSWLERYDKVVASVAASVALFASVMAQRKDLFAADQPPKLAIEGCPADPVPGNRRLMLSPRWLRAPAQRPEKYAWFAEGEPAGTDGTLLWMPPPDGGERSYEINLVAPGYERAVCVVNVKP